MSRKLYISLIVLAAMLIIGLSSYSYASELRLLAMGDMSGIIPDNSDFANNIIEINTVQKGFASISYLSDVFHNSFPQNDQPSVNIIELERKGARDEYQIDLVYPLFPSVNIGMQYSNKTRDYRSSYINSSGDWEKLNRNGNAESKTIVLGYKAIDWLDLMLAYDDTTQIDDYGGTEIDRGGVVVRENSSGKGLIYGFKLHNENMWFGLSLGNNQTASLTYEAAAPSSYSYTYQSSGPSRVSFLAGGKMFEGRIIINYCGIMGRIGVVSEIEGSLGMQIIPYKDAIVGLGIKSRGETDHCGDYLSSSFNAGGEIPLPQFSGFKIRGGIVGKTKSIRGQSYLRCVDESYGTDYCLGFGYNADRIGIDFAYYNYQGIPGGYDKWSAISSLLMPEYIYTATKERNSIFGFSVSYEI